MRFAQRQPVKVTFNASVGSLDVSLTLLVVHHNWDEQKIVLVTKILELTLVLLLVH